MCSGSVPKAPPPPVIPPPPPAPDVNEQLNPVTGPNNLTIKKARRTVQSFRNDLTIAPTARGGLNVPQ
jgi:hypothetical protein